MKCQPTTTSKPISTHIDAAGIRDDSKGALFRSAVGRTLMSYQ